MRFINFASKKAWHWRRRIQRFPYIKVIHRVFNNADPVAGLPGEEAEPEIKTIPVTVNLVSADEIATAQGLLETGDLRVISYDQINQSDEVEYQNKTYRVIHIESEPPNKRFVIYLRRAR